MPYNLNLKYISRSTKLIKKTLFEFYPDEISFEEREFLGITEKAAFNLKTQKDIRYIQS